jgi:uncharacterized protein (UPF0332 family)
MLSGYPNPDGAKIYWKKSRESLKTAKMCINNGLYNNSVSRSYYAVYQSIVAVLEAKGQRVTDKKGKVSKDHNMAINEFHKIYSNQSKMIINFKGEIKSLKDAREDADYETKNFNKKEANKFSKEAIELIRKIKQIN